MGTASEWAPAAQLRLPVGAEQTEAGADVIPLDVGELSLREAARRSGISFESLRAAIEDGRLRARFGRRAYAPRRLGTRSHWLILPAALDAFIASLGACRYPGCDRLGSGPTGCCSGPHAQGVLMAGKPRPGVGAKISAARKGRVFGPRGRCAAISRHWRRFFSTPAGDIERTARAERMRSWWERGEGAPPIVLRLRSASPRVIQVWSGRWGSRTPPGPGARPRGRPRVDVTAETLARVLHQASLGYGRRTIALSNDLSEKVVRRILDEHGPPDAQLSL